MSKRESLIGLNSIFRRRFCKAAMFSVFLFLVIFGSELTYRYLEPEFIYKTIYASNQYSDKEVGSGEVLKQKIFEYYRNEPLIDETKLFSVTSLIREQNLKKRAFRGRLFTLEVLTPYLRTYKERRLHSRHCVFALYTLLFLSTIIMYIHCQDGKKVPFNYH